VESRVVAVVTRFRFRHVWHVLESYRAHRRIVAQASAMPGFLRAAFLVEGLHTCYSFSIWADAEAIPQFGTLVREHVRAGNWAFSRLTRRSSSNPELWSTKWSLRSVSNNLAWEGFDLSSHVREADAWAP